MKKVLLFLVISLSCTLFVCAQGSSAGNNAPNERSMRIKITVGNTILTAFLLDNTTARAFAEKLPLTLPMQDLYNRELVYRFPDPLPTDSVYFSGYTVGEIIYWPPRHSFVIMYAQNGERFSMQKIGHIEDAVEIFRTTGNVNVSFEIVK